jgi:hypothetical protein
MSKLPEQFIATIKDAATELTGSKRRSFQAQVTIDYLNSSARKAEITFGWSRETVGLGLNEVRTGIICVDNFKARGNKKTEEKNGSWGLKLLVWLSPKAKLTQNSKQRSSIPASPQKPCAVP